MVIKTEACFYTEFRIYPGHGSHYVRKDGKIVAFINAKAKALYFQKVKAQKLTWTQQWRRRHKKGKVEAVQKKKRAKAARVYKSIQGLDLEALRKRRALKPDVRKAKREAAVRDVKEKQRKAKEERKKGKQYKKKQAAGFVKVPKVRKNIKMNVGKR